MRNVRKVRKVYILKTESVILQKVDFWQIRNKVNFYIVQMFKSSEIFSSIQKVAFELFMRVSQKIWIYWIVQKKEAFSFFKIIILSPFVSWSEIKNRINTERRKFCRLFVCFISVAKYFVDEKNFWIESHKRVLGFIFSSYFLIQF